MQRLVEDLREDLSAFVEQREALTLVLWAKGPNDAVFAYQLLDSMDQSSNRDVFVLFAEDCYDVDRYVDSLMAACDMDIDLGNKAIARGLADEGAEPWSSLPATCFDDSRRPVERLRALVEHLRCRISDPTSRIVFGLLPARLSNPDAYLELALQLIPWGGYEPWMAGVRFVLCDTHQDARIVGRLIEADAFGALVRPLDFSPEALADALGDAANNSNADPEDRMRAFIQVAGLDQAWGRYDEALRKYAVALGFYQQTANVPLQALCILQSGHVEELAGRRDVARLRFEQAFQLATGGDVKQVALNSARALAQLHQAEGEWARAAEYWEGTALLARAANSLFVLADACRDGGLCRLALNQPDEALEFWRTGATVAEEASYWDTLIQVLGYLIDVLGRQGLGDEQKSCREQLAKAQERWRLQQHEILQARKNAGVSA